MFIQPYLFFDGRCEEAIKFYQQAAGAEVLVMLRFSDSPEPPAPGSEQKVMHATFKVGDTTVQCSDGRCGGKPMFQGFALSLTVASEADAETTFAALGDGGRVEMPMMQTFFAKRFGMLFDRFGVCWMVIAQ